MENGKSSSISGDLNINYNNQFGKHTIFGNALVPLSPEKNHQHIDTRQKVSPIIRRQIFHSQNNMQKTVPLLVIPQLTVKPASY